MLVNVWCNKDIFCSLVVECKAMTGCALLSAVEYWVDFCRHLALKRENGSLTDDCFYWPTYRCL